MLQKKEADESFRLVGASIGSAAGRQSSTTGQQYASPAVPQVAAELQSSASAAIR